jgi:hypothetical protein
MQKCLKIHFVSKGYFVVYQRCQKYGIPITQKLKLTCVVNYPPRPDDVLKCKLIAERALSPIIIWKNANHQAKVKF